MVAPWWDNRGADYPAWIARGTGGPELHMGDWGTRAPYGGPGDYGLHMGGPLNGESLLETAGGEWPGCQCSLVQCAGSSYTTGCTTLM